jgi:hypothetical protein
MDRIDLASANLPRSSISSVLHLLPAPDLDLSIEISADPAMPLSLASLPAKPGVFAIEDGAGRTLSLATTANLRRMVASRLQPQDHSEPRSRRTNYRDLARAVRATVVGSTFEADWAYLQLARSRLPQTYRQLLDRWQAWFIHCDPAAPFPQFTKTAHPNPLAQSGDFFGPFPDKHAAGRYIEMLQDVFDLCRYHHILVQAPHGAACAYKEMDRCPAPCDGTVSMESYRAQVRQAIEFACAPKQQWAANIERAMSQASATLDFESAGRLKERLKRAQPAMKREFALVDCLERFAFVGVFRAPVKGRARLFAILGGWIAPIMDMRMDCESQAVHTAFDVLQPLAHDHNMEFSDAAAENMAVVCWHLFRPQAAGAQGQFIRIPEHFTVDALAVALRKLSKVPIEQDEPAAAAGRDIEIDAGGVDKTM